MKIRVTESHIERGRTCHSRKCPLARAFVEATGNTWNIGHDRACRERDGLQFMFPAWLQAWVLSYDRGEPVQPIDFEVPPLSGVDA